MDSPDSIDLTASEMQYLWSMYQAQSLNIGMLKYFDSILEDEEVKQFNKKLLTQSESYLEEITTIFNKEEYPIPIAFSDADVKTTVKKLYTEPFILYYQWFVAKGNVTFASMAINTISRADVFQLFNKCITSSLSLLDEARKMLLSKGIWIRTPYIPVPKEVDFIKKENFLNGWFGEQRPLIGFEIASAFYNILTNSIGVIIMKSFIQSSEDEEIKKYLIKGKELAIKHIDVLSDVLKEDELPTPSVWNTGVTTSTEAPFSEKFMLNLVSLINAQGISNYGNAIATTMRRDIGLHFTNLGAEAVKYSEEGVNLLIERGWLEAPPQAPRNN